jgi:DNA ligase-1
MGFTLFALLIKTLSASTKTSDKMEAMVQFFQQSSEDDTVWVIALFTGRQPKRTIKTTLLMEWCKEITHLPEWLIQECYHTVGDLAETLALLLPNTNTNPSQGKTTFPLTTSDFRLPTYDLPLTTNNPLPTYHLRLSSYIHSLQALKNKSVEEQRAYITYCWSNMAQNERFVFNKLITGNFRTGVSQQILINALAQWLNQEPATIAHRISGNWNPSTASFQTLLGEGAVASDHSKPYPFYLAYPLEDPLSTLGEPSEWQAEWKWDGIRGQLIKRNDNVFIWSRGEELMTEKFPELNQWLQNLPNGIVLDGEIICLGNLANHEWIPYPFALLQTRIGRKNISKKQLAEAPVGFIVYDVLEINYTNLRDKPLFERRNLLESFISLHHSPNIKLSPIVNFDNWDELLAKRLAARNIGSEGLMLKRKTSPYLAGRKRGDWWKWKTDPFTIDAVLIYAQKGHGQRANLYSDYSFAVKDGDKLVPFAKAYSGLTNKEILEVDAFVKNNGLEKFGPVRTVKPELVFELGFEGIAASNRHKSGVAVRFPRILRWRKDKTVEDINTLDDLQKMLSIYGK